MPYYVPDLRAGIPRSDSSFKEIGLYPNPANERLMLSFPDRQITSIEILDQLGHEQLSLKLFDRSEAQIDISQLSAGLYFVLLQNVHKAKTVKKFIKL